MLTDEAAQNFFTQISDSVVMPEVERRQKAGTLPTPFGIKQCLILFSDVNSPTIQFNDEVAIVSKAKIHTDKPMQAGDPVYIGQIQDIKSVLHPQIDGKNVPYVYLFPENGSINLIFDFSLSADVLDENEKSFSPSSDAILKIQKRLLLSKTTSFSFHNKNHLTKIGLWVIPALLPYPLAQIATLVSEDKAEEALKLFTDHCSNDFISELINKWTLPEYETRKKLFDDSFKAHCHNLYTVTIPALLPQIEGIFTDWLHRKGIPDIPWRVESRTKKLRDTILSSVKEAVHEYSMRSVLEFILEGPVLEEFDDWLSKINSAFPGRHAVSHGKYDESIFTQQNSIKVFLILDAIFRMLNYDK